MRQFTIKELSELYQVSVKTIRKHAKKWGCGYAPGIGLVVFCVPTDNPVLLPHTVSKIIGVSNKIVQRWCSQGIVKAFKIGSLWRIDYKDGMRLISKRTKGFTSMNKLSVTTIRHKLTDLQLSELMIQYQTDPGLKHRVDIDNLAKAGVSRKTVKENGYEVETIITIDKD